MYNPFKLKPSELNFQIKMQKNGRYTVRVLTYYLLLPNLYEPIETTNTMGGTTYEVVYVTLSEAHRRAKNYCEVKEEYKKSNKNIKERYDNFKTINLICKDLI
jgi:hypothetical protein